MADMFLVTCHGWSSSSWLANVLNHHPDVYCSHLIYNRLPGTDDSDDNLAKNNYFDTVRTEAQSRLTTPINTMLERMQSEADTAYVGNVGLYRLRDLPYLTETFGQIRQKVKIINLIRDPVSLVCSGYHQFQKRFRFDLHELSWNLNKLLQYSYPHLCEMAKQYDLTLGDTDTLSFFAAAQTLASLKMDIAAEAQVSTLDNVDFLGHCRMEDITTNDSELANVIYRLLPGLSDVEGLCRQGIRIGPINRHQKNGASMAEQRYKQLHKWQKTSLAHFWQKNDVEGFYRRQNYCFDYLQSTAEAP